MSNNFFAVILSTLNIQKQRTGHLIESRLKYCLKPGIYYFQRNVRKTNADITSAFQKF